MAKTKKTSDASKEAKKLAKKGSGKTHLAFLLDETGSMMGNEEAVVEGVNDFLHTFKEQDGDTRVWLAMFDKHAGAKRTRVKIEGRKVKKCDSLTVKDYSPRGATPLYDAIVDTIEAMDEKVGKKERAFVVILTDGLENSSEHDAADVEKLIKAREEQGWAFLYLGANQVAHKTAAEMGLSAQHALTFTSSKKGTSSAMRRGSDRAMAYSSSPDRESYLAVAASDTSRTGGIVAEDEIDED